MRVLSTFRTVLSLAYTPDGRRLVSAGGGPHVSLWYVHSGEEFPVVQRSAGTFCQGVVVSPDGRKVAWLAQYTGRTGFDLRSGLVNPPRQTSGNRVSAAAGVWEMSARPAAYLPNGTLIVRRATAVAEARPGGRVLFTTDSHADHLAIHPDGSVIVVGTADGVRTVRTADWAETRRDKLTRRVVGLTVSPTGQVVCTTEGHELVVFGRRRGVAFRDGRVRSRAAAFTPDGRHLIAAGLDAAVVVFATEGWGERARYDWQTGCGEAVAVAPDGLTAAVGGFSGDIAVFDLDF